MGKKERSANPVDILRKQQRKRELKKNKEDKKKGQLVALSQRNTAKLELEYRQLKEQERAGTLDANGRLRAAQIQSKIAEINSARTQLGLAPKVLRENASSSKGSKPAAAAVAQKYTDDADQEDMSDASIQNEMDAEDSEEAVRDLSHIPIPDGVAPETEGQTYFALLLPEVLDPLESERRKQLKLEEKRERLERGKQEMQAAQAAAQQQHAGSFMPQFLIPNGMSFPPYPYGFQIPVPGQPHPMPMMMAQFPGQPPMHGFPPGFHPGVAQMHPGMPPQLHASFPQPPHAQTVPWTHAAVAYASSISGVAGPQHNMRPPYQPHPNQSGRGRNRPHEQQRPRQQQPRSSQQPSHASTSSMKLPNKPGTATVISAEPQIRDLRKELTQFVPSVLRKRQTGTGDASKPAGS